VTYISVRNRRTHWVKTEPTAHAHLKGGKSRKHRPFPIRRPDLHGRNCSFPVQSAVESLTALAFHSNRVELRLRVRWRVESPFFVPNSQPSCRRSEVLVHLRSPSYGGQTTSVTIRILFLCFFVATPGMSVANRKSWRLPPHGKSVPSEIRNLVAALCPLRSFAATKPSRELILRSARMPRPAWRSGRRR